MSEQKKFIEVEAAKRRLSEYCENSPYFRAWQTDKIMGVVDSVKTADVRPTEEVSAAADEAIRILNAIQSAGRIEYPDYCELHDAISEIYGQHEAEEAQA